MKDKKRSSKSPLLGRGRGEAVNLPAPPKQWNQLTARQLVGIHKLMRKGYSEAEFKLRALLLLLDLKIPHRADKEDDGTFTYKFRRRGLWPWLKREELSMKSWEAKHWIDEYLKFLDEPYQRTMAAWEYKRIGGRKFRAPDSLLLNMTYQQFGNCQRYLQEMWNCSKMVETMLDNGSSRDAVKEMLRRADKARALFVSHMFVSGRRQVLERKEDSTYLSLKRVYQYDQRAAQRRLRLFRRQPAWLFDICYQLFQSTLAHYKTMFPMLFKEHEGKDGRSALTIELETINVIKRECGYESQQAVYDANAVFVFEDLNMLATRAKQMKDAKAGMKAKR